MPPLQSAHLKLDRAAEHIANFSEILRNDPPFISMLETDTEACKRSIFVKKNKPIINKLAILTGDAIGNLRESLDHAYWEITSHLIGNKISERDVQFPIHKSFDGLKKSTQYRLAQRLIASKIGSTQTLADVIFNLKPHLDNGGNTILFLINEMKRIDKHRLLIPVKDNKTIDRNEIVRLTGDPFVPKVLLTGSTFGDNTFSDFAWKTNPYFLKNNLGKSIPPTTHKFEKIIDLPIEIFFVVWEASYRDSAIRTLNAMRDDVDRVLSDLAPFSPYF